MRRAPREVEAGGPPPPPGEPPRITASSGPVREQDEEDHATNWPLPLAHGPVVDDLDDDSDFALLSSCSWADTGEIVDFSDKSDIETGGEVHSSPAVWVGVGAALVLRGKTVDRSSCLACFGLSGGPGNGG